MCAHASLSSPISMILVFAPMLQRPYPLIPSEEYKVCLECEAMFNFVNRAVDAHPKTREAGGWSRAILVTDDGDGYDVTSQREVVRA